MLTLLFRAQYVKMCITFVYWMSSQLSAYRFFCASEVNTIPNSHFWSCSLSALSVTLFFSTWSPPKIILIFAVFRESNIFFHFSNHECLVSVAEAKIKWESLSAVNVHLAECLYFFFKSISPFLKARLKVHPWSSW